MIHSGQSGSAHFIQPQFRCGAKTILYGAQHAIRMMPLAFKLEHHIDHVFQNLGPSK